MADLNAAHLRALGGQRLATVLRLRPDAADPAPPSLSHLAGRLREPLSVVAALRRLNLPTLQVAEAIAALGGAVARPDLHRLLGPAQGKAIDLAVERLRDLALVVETPDDRLALESVARFAWSNPLKLGSPAEELVGLLHARDVATICTRLGVAASGRTAATVHALLAALRDAELIRSTVDRAPEEFRDVLHRIAVGGVRVTEYGHYGPGDGADRTPVRWAASRGLLLRTVEWANEFQMPAEVALALRGPDYTAPFDPDPPACPRVSTDIAASGTAAVERDATAAAIDFLRLATNLLDEASRTRVATVRTGGVGVRELKRLAKTHGATTDQVRLVFAAAHAAELIRLGFDGVTPTEEYDTWLDAEPADRLAQLVQGWWSLPAMPTLTPTGPPAAGRAATGTTDRPWGPNDVDERAAALRQAATLRAGDGEGPPTDWSAFADVLCWHHPHLRRDNHATVVASVEAWRGEASTVGVLGAGRLSAAGRALLAGDPEALVAAYAGAGSVVRTAHLQADLTAVVPGTPAAALSTVLDACADRESVAAASTWRFSPASVRRALDAGHTADALIADLSAVAAGGVPQTLEYLVRDVARRHGTVRASQVACCLRGEDTVLLAEIAADKRLRALQLHRLAPTVLGSRKPLADTLAALRKAGYAPVEEDADGLPVLQPTAIRRTTRSHIRRAHPEPAHEPRSEDALRSLVTTLLAAPDDAGPPRPRIVTDPRPYFEVPASRGDPPPDAARHRPQWPGHRRWR